MALIKCPDCEKEISDQAVSCIHCGRPIQSAPAATADSHQAHKAAVSAGNQSSKARYDLGKALGMVGFATGVIIGIAVGSWTVGFVAAMIGGGVGLAIQYSQPSG